MKLSGILSILLVLGFFFFVPAAAKLIKLYLYNTYPMKLTCESDMSGKAPLDLALTSNGEFPA